MFWFGVFEAHTAIEVPCNDLACVCASTGPNAKNDVHDGRFGKYQIDAHETLANVNERHRGESVMDP